MHGYLYEELIFLCSTCTMVGSANDSRGLSDACGAVSGGAPALFSLWDVKSIKCVWAMGAAAKAMRQDFE